MHDQCPPYYRITPTEDLNHWCATALRTATWRTHTDATLLDLLYFNFMRYAVRLPFKGISEPAIVRDIDKAITQLQDLRAALVPLDAGPELATGLPRGQAPEVVQSPELQGTCAWDTLTPHQQAHLRTYRMGEESWYVWQRPDGDSHIFSICDNATWAHLRKYNATARLIEIPEEGA